MVLVIFIGLNSLILVYIVCVDVWFLWQIYR